MKQPMIPLPLGLVRALGDYLTARPYGEVAELMAGLQGAVTAASQAVAAPAPPTPPAPPKPARTRGKRGA